MRFAKAVFSLAGIFGVLALAPLYFLFDVVGRKYPPPITHPQFYFGFVGVALAWQAVFYVIGTDPVRFRPLMIPSVLEKAGYVGALAVLFLRARITALEAVTGVPDALLGVLFLISFFKTPSR